MNKTDFLIRYRTPIPYQPGYFHERGIFEHTFGDLLRNIHSILKDPKNNILTINSPDNPNENTINDFIVLFNLTDEQIENFFKRDYIVSKIGFDNRDDRYSNGKFYINKVFPLIINVATVAVNKPLSELILKYRL